MKIQNYQFRIRYNHPEQNIQLGFQIKDQILKLGIDNLIEYDVEPMTEILKEI